MADADKNNTGNGGGFANSGQASLRNNIIAQNVDSSGAAGEVHADVSLVGGDITSSGRNVIGIDTGASSSFGLLDVHGNAATPLNPHISSLLGTPPRHLLMGSSPALERVAASVCIFDSEEGNALFADNAKATTDEAGNPRPIDYNGNGTATCDSGAVEMRPAMNLPFVTK